MTTIDCCFLHVSSQWRHLSFWLDRPTENAFYYIYHLFRIRCQLFRPIHLPLYTNGLKGAVGWDRREWPLRFIPPLPGASPSIRQSNHALHSALQGVPDVCANVKRKLTSPQGSCRPHASRTGNKIYFGSHKFYGWPAKGRWPEAQRTLAVEPPERVVIGPTPPPSSRPPWTGSSHTSDTDSEI